MGYLISLFAAFLLALSITILHFAYQGGAVAEQIVFIRFMTVGLVLFIFLVVLKKQSIHFLKKYFHKNWIISLLFIVQTYGYVMSIRYIPVGLAAIIFYSFPLIIYLIQVATCQEKVQLNNIIALILGMLGVYFTIDLTNINLSIIGIAYAAIAAFAQAGVSVISQNNLKNVSAENMMLITGLQCTFLLPLLYMGYYGVAHTLQLFDMSIFFAQPIKQNGIAIALMASFFFTTGITLYFFAIKLSSATKASIIMYSEPAFTVFVAAFLIGEIIGRNQIIGLILIIGAGLITQIHAPRKPKAR